MDSSRIIDSQKDIKYLHQTVMQSIGPNYYYTGSDWLSYFKEAGGKYQYFGYDAFGNVWQTCVSPVPDGAERVRMLRRCVERDTARHRANAGRGIHSPRMTSVDFMRVLWPVVSKGPGTRTVRALWSARLGF